MAPLFWNNLDKTPNLWMGDVWRVLRLFRWLSSRSLPCNLIKYYVLCEDEKWLQSILPAFEFSFWNLEIIKTRFFLSYVKCDQSQQCSILHQMHYPFLLGLISHIELTVLMNYLIKMKTTWKVGVFNFCKSTTILQNLMPHMMLPTFNLNIPSKSSDLCLKIF